MLIFMMEALLHFASFGVWLGITLRSFFSLSFPQGSDLAAWEGIYSSFLSPTVSDILVWVPVSAHPRMHEGRFPLLVW